MFTSLRVVGAVALFTVMSGNVAAGPVFQGETIDDWTEVGEAKWVFGQGEISAHGTGDGYVTTNGEYSDFHLALEFWVDATTNSGVFIRCQRRDRIHPETCYELNIRDEHPKQEARTGSIVFNVMPPLARVDTVGKWNSLDVVAEGGSLTVTVNGVVTATMKDARPESGFIALQHFSEGTVRFRNIRLER